MNQVDLTVYQREIGKQASKKLRRTDMVPGIFYMEGKPGIPFAAKNLSLRSIVYTSETKLINMKFDGEDLVRKCFLKKVDIDPITDKPVHVDFVGIDDNKKMNVEVPIVIVGTAEGVRMGGILSQAQHKVKIECLPIHAPNHIEVDVTKLGVGKSIHLRDIQIENVTFKTEPDTLIVHVLASRVSMERSK